MSFQIIPLEKEQFAPLFELDDDIAQGTELADLIERLLKIPAVDYLHLHWAKFGCYAAKVVAT